MLVLRAQVYWINWLLLVLGAASTGVASVSDAFFRGAVASFLAAGALRAYRELGPRRAAFLGLAVGVAWQLLLHHTWGRVAWNEAYRAAAEGRLGMEISVSAAAFAGSALAAALLSSGLRLPKAAGVGALLALGMTALPYGIVNELDRRRAGPIDVVWLAEATELGEDGRPLRPIGVQPPALSPAEVAALRQRFLTVEVAGEVAAVGPDGRRLWPAWRQRLTQPGHEGLPARGVLVVNRLPVGAPVPAADLGLSESASGTRGIEYFLEEGAPRTAVFGDQPSDEPHPARLEVGSNAGGAWVRAVRLLPFSRSYPAADGDRRNDLPVGVPGPATRGARAAAPEENSQGAREPGPVPVIPAIGDERVGKSPNGGQGQQGEKAGRR